MSIVNYVCGGDSDGNDKCVFPFVYKGKRFFECTSFDRDAPWCSIKNDGGQAMKEWAYCLCPSEKLFTQEGISLFVIYLFRTVDFSIFTHLLSSCQWTN